MKNKIKRFTIIGGVPFRCYTGTTTYTRLLVVDSCNTEKQAEKAVKKHYDACGGLLLVIDTMTGKEHRPTQGD